MYVCGVNEAARKPVASSLHIQRFHSSLYRSEVPIHYTEFYLNHRFVVSLLLLVITRAAVKPIWCVDKLLFNGRSIQNKWNESNQK